MTLVLAILAGWFALSIVVGIGIGRAARLGSGSPRVAEGQVERAQGRSVSIGTAERRAPQQRRQSGPAAAA